VVTVAVGTAVAVRAVEREGGRGPGGGARNLSA
jgi:hypothetical protein